MKVFVALKVRKCVLTELAIAKSSFLAFVKSGFLDLVKFHFLYLAKFAIVDRFLILLPILAPSTKLLVALNIF